MSLRAILAIGVLGILRSGISATEPVFGRAPAAIAAVPSASRLESTGDPSGGSIQDELAFHQAVARIIVGETAGAPCGLASDSEIPPAGGEQDAFPSVAAQLDCDDSVELARASQARVWNFTLLVGNEYDSNIGSFPDFEGLGAVRDKGDSRFLLAGFGEIKLLESDHWNVGMIGSVFTNFHYQQDPFNLQDYMGGAYANYLLAEQWMSGVRYEFHETRLGGNHLASDNRLVSNLTRFWGDVGHTTAYYEYDTAASNAPFLIPAQIQSADVNAVGLTQAFYTFEQAGRLFLGYRYEDVNAKGNDFDRFTHMLTARAEVPCFEKTIWDAEVRHFWDDYFYPNSLDFLDRARYDTRVEVRTGIQHNYRRDLALRFDYTFIATNSNVANLFGVNFFEYDRHIVTTQLIYTF